MKSNFNRLGDYIKLVDVRNTDLKIDRLLGMNISKNFMPSVANVSETDLTKYKIIRKGQFAYSAMQVGRDETVRVSLFRDEDPAIISPAYLVFEVIDRNIVLPEFLMMWFQRPESDRYGWFISDGSVRSSLEWERFCEILVPIPDDIEEQRNYVHIYNGLLNNQQCYERSLYDLKHVCNHAIESLIKDSELDKVGNLIQVVDNRNTDLKIDRVLGININKSFMPSVANLSETDLSKYKVIRKGQFAYSAMQVGRDETIRIALYHEEEPAIISPAYFVFEVKDTKTMMPEFLMMWFQRPESDRFGWFISDGSVRASLEWERFCEIQMPIPKRNTQESLVLMHHALETRKRVNKRLKSLVTPLCPVLMKGAIDSINDRGIENGLNITAAK